MWKIIFVEFRPVVVNGGVHRDPNAIATQHVARFFFKHMPEDAEW